MSIQNDNQKCVRWAVFVWAIGIITTILMASVGVSMSAMSIASEVKNKYETDILWIRDALAEIKVNINK